MNQVQRKTTRGQRDELLTLLNGWDPAGLLQAGAPRDEYDCVVDQLLSELARGAGRDEVTQFLEREIGAHFGVEPKDAQQFATKAVTWYELSAREESAG
jgi:hypothetical protein